MDIYYYTNTRDEEELVRAEVKYLFNADIEKNYFITDEYIDIDRSAFTKCCIRNFRSFGSFEELKAYIIDEEVSYNKFKVKYVDIDKSIDFETGHSLESIIGYEIIGRASMKEPEIVLGITTAGGRWFFGEYEKSSNLHHLHNSMPQHYCNALPTKISRAIVNIAAGRDKGVKLVDPCCGIGTVVIEGLSMDLNIEGFDINTDVVRGARRNLRFFGYPERVDYGNIHEITDKYNVAILDLPYGILSKSSRSKQNALLISAGRIADKVLAICIDDNTEAVEACGLNIEDRIVISKGKFKRYLYVCRSSHASLK